MPPRCVFFCLVFLWGFPAPLRAAGVGDVRVSVFKQGTSTTRSVGSLIGVWHWRGRTFANQHANVWTPSSGVGSTSADYRGVGICAKDPRYAFAGGETMYARFTGTTWLFDALQSVSHTELYPIAPFNSSFAVVGQQGEDLWRWSGTSWLHDIDGETGRFRNISLFSTDYAWAFVDGNSVAIPGRAILSWDGSTWATQLTQSADFIGTGVMVDTAYGWYFGRPSFAGVPNVYQWRGTSWQIFARLSPWGDTPLAKAAAIPYERDFALVVGNSGEVWRWAGTSWFAEKFATSNFNDCAAVQTDHAWAAGQDGSLWQWTGTSWVSHGPLQTNNFTGLSAIRTDYAFVVGGAGNVWRWQGTSWLREPLEEGNNVVCVATAGGTLAHVGSVQSRIWTRQRVSVADDGTASGTPPSADWSGTLYRTVVQVMPTDSDWNWNGESSDTDSYFGVLNKDGNSYDFLDEGDSTAAGWQIVLERGADSVADREDIFIWEDTVGWWDGHSSAHNRDPSSGTRLVYGGIVHNDLNSALNADVWGETDARITSAAASAIGGNDLTWEQAAGDATVTANSGVLTWEFWHRFDAGLAQGESIETAIHVEKDPGDGSTDTLAGISWEYRVGHYRPRIGNWRWCLDDAAAPQIMKEPRGRLLEAAPTGERLRLRVRVDETDGGRMPQAVGSSGWTLWYSSDQTTWTQVTTASSVWKLVDGQGTAGSSASAATMPEVDTLGIVVESDSANNGKAQEPFTEMEMDFAIESTAAVQNTVYYFEPRHNGHRALPVPGVGYPSVTTLNDSGFNYLYTRPDLGRFSRPLVNPAFQGGEAFKVVYVGTQGGASDQLFAISRTSGGVVRSYSASGTLEHGNLYWDSTNSRYNLFFRQGNSVLLALKDDGGTIAANTSWTTNPLNMTNLIGRPVRVFDGDKQNYLFLLVTSFQGNTSTLYKIRAADGTVVADGNYSKSAADVGWGPGLRVSGSFHPLWVEGTAYALGADNGSDDKVVKIPSGGGVTGGSPGSSADIADFPPTYTRTTITTGGRILVCVHGVTQTPIIDSAWEGVGRLNDGDMMPAAGEWDNNTYDGMSQDIDDGNTIRTSPFSPPFQSAFPVPVFVGDSSQINRLAGSDGTQEVNFPYDLTGAISTEIMIKGDWLYFGTNGGYIYALSATDPTQGVGTRFRVPGDHDVVGVALDGTNSLVYYTTADGRIYQFDTR